MSVRTFGNAGSKPVIKPEPVSEEDIVRLKEMLLERRKQISVKVDSLRDDAVAGNDSANWEEDGTDAFNREFAFKMAGSGNDMVNQIDDALRMIDENSYAICESCGEKIGRLRMEALLFCKTCIQCQSESEADRAMYGRVTV